MLKVSCAFSVYISVWFILQVSHLVLVHPHMYLFILQVSSLVFMHTHVYLFMLQVSSCVYVYNAGDQLGFSADI